MTYYKVITSERAKLDLESIYLYELVNTLDLEISESTTIEIIERINSLNIFPTRNPIYEEDIRYGEIRKLVMNYYNILHSINEENKTVLIYRIMSQKQDKL